MVDFLSSVDWKSALIGVLVGIPFTLILGYIINLTTPSLREWIAEKKEARRKSKIEKLREIKSRIQKYKSDPSSLYLKILDIQSRALLVVMLAIGALIAERAFESPVYLYIALGFLTSSTVHAVRHVSHFRKVHDFLLDPSELDEKIEEAETDAG